MRKSAASFAKAALYRKQYYEEHREQEDAATRRYLVTHRESIAKKRRELYQRRADHFRSVARGRYHALSREQKRAKWLKGTYGISVEQLEAMTQAQGGCCAVCGKRPSYRLGIDHRHGTRQIRGLLCRRCNIFVGYLETGGPGLTAKAVRYLETHANGTSCGPV